MSVLHWERARHIADLARPQLEWRAQHIFLTLQGPDGLLAGQVKLQSADAVIASVQDLAQHEPMVLLQMAIASPPQFNRLVQEVIRAAARNGESLDALGLAWLQEVHDDLASPDAKLLQQTDQRLRREAQKDVI